MAHPRSTAAEGYIIGSEFGSENTSGQGSFAAEQNITCQITAEDLLAAAPGGGASIIKIFICDEQGRWSS